MTQPRRKRRSSFDGIPNSPSLGNRLRRERGGKKRAWWTRKLRSATSIMMRESSSGADALESRSRHQSRIDGDSKSLGSSCAAYYSATANCSMLALRSHLRAWRDIGAAGSHVSCQCAAQALARATHNFPNELPIDSSPRDDRRGMRGEEGR